MNTYLLYRESPQKYLGMVSLETPENIAIFTWNQKEKTMEDHGVSRTNKPRPQFLPLFPYPVQRCLIVVILSAIAGIMVNECKRSKIRLEHDRQKYQQNDTIAPNATAQNTLFLKYLPRSR